MNHTFQVTLDDTGFDSIERASLSEAIKLSGGDIKAAAQILKISRSAFYAKANRLGLEIRRSVRLATAPASVAPPADLAHYEGDSSETVGGSR